MQIPAINSVWTKESHSSTRIVDVFCVREVFAVRADGTHPRHVGFGCPSPGALVAFGERNGRPTYLSVKRLFASWQYQSC